MANSKKLKLTTFKFKPFSDKQMKVLNWWTEKSPVNDAFMLVADGAIRSGKSNHICADIYTPDGCKKMGDIKIGDYVFNRIGQPVKVIGVFPQGKLDVYEVEFHDGSKTICSEDHLWSYTTRKCITNGNRTMFTSSLGEIMQDLEKFKDRKHMNQRAGKYRFPLNGCVEFNSKEVKIDPYMLGLLIGDGCFSGGHGITFTKDEDVLHKYIENTLPQYGMKYIYHPRTETHCAVGHLGNGGNRQKTTLRTLLEEYGLYGHKSDTKFIPVDYKYNSKEVRLKILAGLLNTDGSVHVKNRQSIEFCSTSKQLLGDVAEIARSLGLFVNTDIKPDIRENKTYNACYSCSIRVNKELYELLLEKHKKRLNLDPTKSKDWRLIKSITYKGKEECQCIYVDDEEHLYLTDDFIVTHNTVSMSLSFVLFVMNTFNQQNVAMCGKSVGSFRRNVLITLKQMLMALNYEIIEHRSENYLEIIKDEVTNYFYIFGGRDESSQDLIQGRVMPLLIEILR